MSGLGLRLKQDQLHKMIAILGTVVQPLTQDAATSYRDGGTGWTVAEVVGHMLDYEVVFLERAQITAEQRGGELPNPEPDALVIERGYNRQQLGAIYAQWVQRRTDLLKYLAELKAEDWDKMAQHPRRGEMALTTQLELINWHDVNHLEQITRIVAEQKQ